MTKSATQSAPQDELQHALARFSHEASVDLNTEVNQATLNSVMDALGVSLGALTHPGAEAARRYAQHAVVERGAMLWGTGQRVTAEVAALVNGVPLRGYDYNDLYIGKKGGGHPSDMIPGLIALAEWRDLPGEKLIGAVALGYEVALILSDYVDLELGGWDYPNMIAIGATCAAARLIGLTEAQTREALAITVAPHFASNEVESSELNARGDLTLWKRFNGGDAIRQSVYACLLADAGVEGVVRPFEGRHGFLAKVRVADEDRSGLLNALKAIPALTRVTEVTFKRWPVGSRGQSAIQAALQARAQVADPWHVREVRVSCDEQVFDHLVRLRDDPWHPTSRETADHSLPYIVATAVLDGYVDVSSFDLDRVRDPDRQQFLVEKVKVESDAKLSLGAKGGFLSRIEIVDADGSVRLGEAKVPPGHAAQPFSNEDFEQKFRENLTPLFGALRANNLVTAIRSLNSMTSVSELTTQFSLDTHA